MAAKVTNNAYGTLSAGITDSATSLTLNSGEGARFPALGAGDYFYATLVDTSNNLEIIKVTARSVDSMTIIRGQDGTTARAYGLNDRLELRPVAALFNEKVDLESITPVSRGGTGRSTLTSNAVIIGNGASEVNAVAPGTAGNVLTSTGSDWVSSPLPPEAGSVTLLATVSATSGNSVSATGLDLSSYTFLEIVATNISSNTGSSTCYISSNNNQTTTFNFGMGSLSGAYDAWGRIHLPVSSDTVVMMNGNFLSGAGITGAIDVNTTTIYFRLASTHTFDNDTGAFKIYGVK
jgi:hypothetical protein